MMKPDTGTVEGIPVGNTEEETFGSLLEETCLKLMERQKEHSIRRLGDMEGELSDLEDSLDRFLAHGRQAGPPAAD
jgi:hypothetical protein